MPPTQSANPYLAMAVSTATPGQLILMLFDGALRSMAVALASFDEKNFVKRNERINNKLLNAQAILAELQRSLNMNVPGEFSRRMFALYGFMIQQLQQANMRKDAEPIRVVEGLLKKIRDAWAQMLENQAETAA